MQTVKVVGGALGAVRVAIELFTDQALPHELSKRFRVALRQTKELLEPWMAEIAPFVEKHAEIGEVMNAAHENFLPFYEDARELMAAEFELEIEPISSRELDAAAKVMQKRADRGIGDPLVWSVAETEILWTVGILTEKGG